MGLFSGGFFGGGTDESSSSTTTNTTTTNTTRDIGLTGANAVAVLSRFSSDKRSTDLAVTQMLGDFAQSLIAGNVETTRLQKDYEGKFVQYQDQQVQKVLQAAQGVNEAGFAAANPELSSIKDIAIIGALAMGAVFIMSRRGR